MLTAVKRNLALIGQYFRLNLASAMEYRGSFWLQVFGMAINNASFVFFWWVAFSKIGNAVAGYTFRDVMFIWAAASSSFGLSRVLFGNVDRISRVIMTGELDNYLMQPRNVLLNVASSRTQVSAWGDLIYGYVLLFLTNGFSLQGVGLFTLFILLGGVFMAATAAIFHTLTFFLGNAERIAGMAFEGIINFCIYPDKIFTGFVRALIYTAIPAGFISHIPLQIYRAFNAGTLALLILAACGYALAAFWLFHVGLKKYESGNLIVTRL
jgi:ABC-2 type transport system permease protein